MAKILIIDHHKTSQATLSEILTHHDLRIAHDATSGIEAANDFDPDLIILELSLSSHSGMEFLYEFRSYSDWTSVPVIVYSSVHLEPEVLNSKTWLSLNISSYLYKPESSLEQVRSIVEKSLTSSEVR